MRKFLKLSEDNLLPIELDPCDTVVTITENDDEHPRKGLVSKVIAEDDNPNKRRKMPASTPIYYSEEIHSNEFKINFWAQKKFMCLKSISRNFNEAWKISLLPDGENVFDTTKSTIHWEQLKETYIGSTKEGLYKKLRKLYNMYGSGSFYKGKIINLHDWGITPEDVQRYMSESKSKKPIVNQDQVLSVKRELEIVNFYYGEQYNQKKIASLVKLSECTVSKVLRYFEENGEIPALSRALKKDYWPDKKSVDDFLNYLWKQKGDLGHTWNHL